MFSYINIHSQEKLVIKKIRCFKNTAFWLISDVELSCQNSDLSNRPESQKRLPSN